MNCDICQRAQHPKKLPFFCVVDARNRLYEGRIANARMLMETEELESRVNKAILDSDASPGASATNRNSRTYIENCTSEEQKARDRTNNIIASVDKLRDEVAAARKRIEEKKASMARKRADLAAASQGLASRRNRHIEETKKAIKMTKYTWDREYEAMAQYRHALCMEVSKLYRLQRVRRGNPVRFEYKIGGIEIIDLQNMNNAQPEHISASLAHITHLLWLASHYLAIRLPAEITLPHNDYPRPTVFSLSSSYHHGDVAFPGSSPFPPDPRDRQFTHVPHPRPLFLDKPLSMLSKEDPPAYNAFLEAVCLLAYDVVWLCRTQGVPVGDNSSANFDDFAYLGRNLYNLLINSSLQRSPQQIANDSSNNNTANSNNNAMNNNNLGDVSPTTTTANPPPALLLTKNAPRMGWFSHGTAHTFLGAAPGTELVRSFRLPNPVKLADKLKARLQAQEKRNSPSSSIPEWEVLDDEAWAPDAKYDALPLSPPPAPLPPSPSSRKKNTALEDEGVLLVGGARPGRMGRGGVGGGFGNESYMSIGTVRSNGGDGMTRGTGSRGKEKEKEKERGSSGWTKVKSR
ncbi:UV radiation resistance protein and autophagy-related subunit 14-domain-containing protein [Camillea tinctor]|nr:UV radiation resistance protein and autophagy-related subunit 14-domain-containing protein [Camillea tinctor]